MSNRNRTLTIELTPESAKLEYDRGIELEFTDLKSSILEHFTIDDVIEHFGSVDLMERMPEQEVLDFARDLE